VRRLLARCLDKDPRSRLRDIGEARIILANPGAADPVTAASASAAPARTSRWWIAAAAAALIAGAAIGRYALAPAAAPAQTFEFDVTIPGTAIETGSFAFSPDGSRLALVTRDAAGERKLTIRDMNAAQVRVLPGTNGAASPFWSPDGREIAYFSESQLNRIALDGAAPRPIATVSDPRGGSWGAGDIILVGSGTGPIRRVPASGGKQPEPVTQLAKGLEDAHAWPEFLPDGKRFVFLADATTDAGHSIRLGSVDGGPTTILKKVVRSQPIVDPAGRLLLAERGQLLAYPFDLARGTLSDASTLVASQIYPLGNQHQLPASAAAPGMLAFQSGSAETDLVVLDNAGRLMRTVGTADRYGNVAVSPDGKRAAFEIFTDTKEKLIWVQDFERGVRTPVSLRGKAADSAAWSPDGETVYFDSNVSEKWEVFRKSVTGGGDPENLGSPGVGDVAVMDVSADGHWLIANGVNGDNRLDLYLRSLDAAGKWTPWSVGPADEGFATFSPDSKWVAYTSDASGKTEVYLAPVDGGPTVHRWPVSSGAGYEPRFSPDGKTVYYRSSALEWMAVDVRFSAGKLEAGTPKPLFALPSIDWPYMRNVIDVLPNGSGFMTVHPPSTAALSIRVRTGK
jgi:eukaryotic-like serine/threonine-protein kinase